MKIQIAQFTRKETLILLLGVTVLIGCDRFGPNEAQLQARFNQQRQAVDYQVVQVRMEVESLLEKEEINVSELQQDAQKISVLLPTIAQTPAQIAIVDKYQAHWQTIVSHLQELKMREQNYQTFLQQSAHASKQLAILTDALDKFAAATVREKTSPEFIYRATGLLYVNERMQHTLTQLTARSSDAMLLVDRFDRDQTLTRQFLLALSEDLKALPLRKKSRQNLQKLLESLHNEFTLLQPVLNEVQQYAPEYIDFVDRISRLEELLAQMSELLNGENTGVALPDK